jgi:uncharacterized protein (TIGR03067 family)
MAYLFHEGQGRGLRRIPKEPAMSMIERHLTVIFRLGAAVVCTVGLLATHGLAGNQPGKTKPDKEAIQGAWIAASAETSGKKVGDDQVKQCRLNFDGDKIEIVGLIQGKGKGTFKLDPTKKPKAIDIFIPDEDDVLGVYELDGKTLKLCLTAGGGDRPKDFTGKGKQMFLVLKR